MKRVYPYEVRTRLIEFRIDRDIYELIKFLASKQGVSPNIYCRNIILAYLKARGLIREP